MIVAHTSIEQQTYTILEKILAELHAQTPILREIADDLAPVIDITGFTAIKENSMVPLAAGQKATFSTTPIPADAKPDPTKIVWTSSDTTNAPVSPNTADPSNLSIDVDFPSTLAAGVSFTLTISYTNSDGTTATESGTFTTVAPPPVDVTGFTAITQTA